MHPHYIAVENQPIQSCL